MKLKLKTATTSKRIRIYIQDSTSTTGGGLTGLVYNSAGLTCYYFRDGDTSATAVSLVTATLGTFTSGGFKEVSAANMPGVYEIGIPNAVLSVGGSAQMVLKGATNMVPRPVEIELDAVDYQDATAFGLSRIDAAISSRHAAGAAVGSVTGNVGGNVNGDINGNLNGSVAGDVLGFVILADASITTAKLGTFILDKATNITGFNDIAITDIVAGAGGAGLQTDAFGYVLLSNGTDPGQVSVNSGIVTVTLNDPNEIRTAIGMSSADLDAQLDLLASQASVDAVQASVDGLASGQTTQENIEIGITESETTIR